MANERIIQNAEKYAEAKAKRVANFQLTPTIEDFIAGAHSRDEEIEFLRNSLSLATNMLRNGNDKLLADYMVQKIELDQLRNPWISVEDRLPDNGDIVFTHSIIKVEGGGERHEEEQFLVQKFIGHWITDRMEQHRMGIIMYDTIDKVTHWMPIPQIEKGE